MTGSAALGTEGYRPQADRCIYASPIRGNHVGGGLEEGMVTGCSGYPGWRIFQKVVVFPRRISVFRKSVLIGFGIYLLLTLHIFGVSILDLFGTRTPLK